MLNQVADGVFVHTSDFIQSNSVVVQGRSGVLLIDPGITIDELADLASDIRELGQPVIAGFATHPDWDHVLWHPLLGEAPRYATARCAASMKEVLSQPDWRTRAAKMLPPDLGSEIPLDLFGEITGLSAGATRIPWNGAEVRIIEHRGHAEGHAALVITESGVLVAGDMLSDILMPFLDLGAESPIEDYLAGLRLLESVADDVTVVVPGHGSVGRAGEVRARIEQDVAYVVAARDGAAVDDPRVGSEAPLYWLPAIHRGQLERLAQRDGLRIQSGSSE
jgi:glyoxylase-like metal-dependent hydrolase (beta-lactamase superfamily II)